MGVGVLLREEHAPDDQARYQPAHVHEVIHEGREADADLLGVRAGSWARVRAGVRAGVREGVRAGSWGEARAGAGARAWGWGSGRGKGWR